MDASVKSISPVVLSASRATDIPAFHAEWFMRSWREGSCLWRNPFNGSLTKVCFDKTRFIVFWSKSPRPIFKHLDELGSSGVKYYFQYTLNDYEREGLEPGVPSLDARVDAMHELSRRLGADGLVWRFDPIILSDSLPAVEIIERVGSLASRLSGYVKRLVISFADIERYRNARRGLLKSSVKWREPDESEIHVLASGLGELGRRYGMEVMGCAEKANLTPYGISRGKCVDEDLMLKLSPEDAILREYLLKAGKDKGQRKECLCVRSKDIGVYSSCRHGCLYCYANGPVIKGIVKA